MIIPMLVDALGPDPVAAEPTATALALQTIDLVKRCPPGTEALGGVSLEIEAREFFGLLGPTAPASRR